jgi:hypothetical protein
MRDKPFNWRPQRRDIGVVFLLPCGKLTARRFLARGDHPAALISLVSDSSARVPDDLRDRRGGERGCIMGFPWKRIRNVNRVPVEQAHQLRVEPGGAVLAAPQLAVLLVGPAGSDGAVDQAHPAAGHLDGIFRSRDELLQDRFDYRHERCHDPRYRRLRHVSHVAQEFLGSVLPEIHARDLHRRIQPARFRPLRSFIPRICQRLADTAGEFLHLREH